MDSLRGSFSSPSAAKDMSTLLSLISSCRLSLTPMKNGSK